MVPLSVLFKVLLGHHSLDDAPAQDDMGTSQGEVGVQALPRSFTVSVVKVEGKAFKVRWRSGLSEKFKRIGTPWCSSGCSTVRLHWEHRRCYAPQETLESPRVTILCCESLRWEVSWLLLPTLHECSAGRWR